jgi:hypothetical protein
MKIAKIKPQIKKNAQIVFILFAVILIVASVIGILLYQQSTILSLSKNVNSMSQRIKKINTAPTVTITNAPTPTLTPTPTLIPVPTLDKQKLNDCLNKADNNFNQGWAGYCKNIYNDSNSTCNKLSVIQANLLENTKANERNDCYNQYYAGN